MSKVELKGHSGCKIYLVTIEGKGAYVRKISRDFSYNERLRQQCAKQKRYKSNNARIPEVLNEGLTDGLYYFDMEYVHGVSMASLLKSCTVDKIEDICDFLVSIIKENMNRVSSETNKGGAVENKLSTIFNELPDLLNDRNIKKAFDMLCNNEWSDAAKSICHGDLSFENMLCSHDGEIYLIDFLDTFYDTWIGDISKVLQDLLVGWSFRHQLMNADVPSENTKIRVLLLRKQFIEAIDNLIGSDKKTWEEIYLHMLLDLLRIIPYINDKRVFAFVNKSIEAIVDNIEQGGLHEHANYTMRWPIYKIPGN